MLRPARYIRSYRDWTAHYISGDPKITGDWEFTELSRNSTKSRSEFCSQPKDYFRIIRCASQRNNLNVCDWIDSAGSKRFDKGSSLSHFMEEINSNRYAAITRYNGLEILLSKA